MTASVCDRCDMIVTPARKTAMMAAITPMRWPYGSDSCPSWWISSSAMSLLCLSGTEFFYFPGEFFELIKKLLVTGIFGAWGLRFQIENAAWFKSTRVDFGKLRE